NRDLTRPVAEIRAREGEAGRRDAGTCTVALPELRRAGVFLCCATVHARIAQHSSSLGGWASPHIAAAVARGQLAYYEGLAAAGELAIVTSGAELAAHYRKWASCSPAHDTVPSGQEAASSTQDAARPIGIILLMECADPLLGPEELAQWVQWGVRAVGPAHFGPNVYAHGTGSEGGLTAAGRTVLQWMERFHLVLDTSHLAPQAFWEALDAFSGPVMASHSNCRTLVPGDRQLDDKQMGAIIAREGVIG